MANHAPARTHIISNQPASPIALAKSTAIGPKAMRYRNGFMRIVISVRPPRPLARPQYQQSAPCWDRKKPRLWWAGLRITRDIRGSQTLASAAGQFRARGLVPERKAPPKRGQVYCGRKGTLGLPQQSNSGGGGWFLQRRALATRVTECCRRTTDVRCFQPFRGKRGRRVRRPK